LERAEQCLRRAVELNPKDANIPTALGVALGRMGRYEEAVEVLRGVVKQDARNPWAHRSLGAMLIQTDKIAEAIPHCQLATQMLPNDQIAWLGLADAHRLAGNAKEAERAYVTAIQINPHSDLAEKAREGSNLLAQSGFDQVRQLVPRQDAVNYCLAAMKCFAQMSPSEFQKFTLELAMTGSKGFAVHDPNSRYRVKGLDGDFSGLAMVCYLYVAMQRMSPGTNIGFDVASEYEQAKRIFDALS
jgi:tetratricopeptide (TPR) repeat protein